MSILAKTAMIVSFLYYAGTLGVLWLGQILGLHNEIWSTFGLPIQPTSPPTLHLIAGLAMTVLTLASLFYAYLAVWKILSGGPQQDFRRLALLLKRISLGLLGFWLGYNLLTGAMPHLLASGLDNIAHSTFEWDPLDIDVLFPIIAIVLIAISGVMHRAWEAEDENSHFL